MSHRAWWRSSPGLLFAVQPSARFVTCTVNMAAVTCSYERSISSSTVTTSRTEAGAVKDGTIRVKVTPPREVSQPPSPPSLIHSPVYVQKALIKSSADSTNASLESTSTSSLLDVDMERNARDGNSLLWALKQVDRSLDELEQNPLPLQREIYELSRSPVGTATSSALTTAARVTVAATKEAVKAAVPVGQWVITEGTKAAISFMSRAMAESAKQQKQPGVSASSNGGPGKQAGKNGGIQRK
ncbi:hypothetical protein Vretimale_11671 [Volvox reticuliferus]|uniref:Uncharacterized protein n=1 Tax=Volvox reticuliferus TaxID=1737510 RepID=A0A8J4CMW6_9CHLO|nr:hypothetical protein Vretifemale_14738 [Volvox reticuliferus]GIM07591.1 hypothetical protein Vretimale_11671 [Volvox reticuliferus]